MVFGNVLRHDIKYYTVKDTVMKRCSYELYTVVCIQRSGEEGSDDILTVVKCVQ